MNISTPYFKENNNDENYIPLAKPSITKKEIAYVNEAMINGWGEYKSIFIEKKSKYKCFLTRKQQQRGETKK